MQSSASRGRTSVILLALLGLFALHLQPSAAAANVQLPILMYHKVELLSPPSILRVPPRDFARQMQYLAAHGYHTISLAQWVAHVKNGGPLPSKPIVITFDDGYQDDYDQAVPVLNQHHFTATFFIITQKAGTNIRWVREAGRPLTHLMDWRHIQTLDHSHMEIGGHSLTHPFLTELPASEQYRQIHDSLSALRSHLQHPVTVFAYPYGDYDATTLQAAKSAGVVVAVTTKDGFNTTHTPLLELRRIWVPGGESLQTFAWSLHTGKSGHL